METTILETEFLRNLDTTFIQKNDIYYFLKYLNNKSYFYDFIINNNVADLRKILKNIVIKVIDYNEVLFNEGDISNNFYIILKGEVGVYRKFGIIKDLSKFKTKNKLLYLNYIINKFTNSFYKKFKSYEKYFDEELQNFNFKKVAILAEGTSFGDKGNINNKKRNATIISELYKEIIFKKKDDIFQKDIKDFVFYQNMVSEKYKNKVIFGYLNKEFFNKFMKEFEIKKINKKFFWFKNIFKNISNDENLHAILYYFKINKIQHKSYLFKKGDKFNKIYIIVNGKINLVDTLKISNINDNILNEINKDKISDSISQNYMNYLKLKLKKNNYLSHKSLNTIARTLDDKDFIGLHELSENVDNYLFDAKIESKELIYYELDISCIDTCNKSNFNFKDILLNHLINFDCYKKRKNTLELQWKQNLKSVDYNSVNSINNSNNSNIDKKKFTKINLLWNKKSISINKYKNMYNTIINIDNNRNLKANNSLNNSEKFNKIDYLSNRDYSNDKEKAIINTRKSINSNKPKINLKKFLLKINSNLSVTNKLGKKIYLKNIPKKNNKKFKIIRLNVKKPNKKKIFK